MGGGEGAQPAEIRGAVYTPLIVGNSRWSRSAVSCEGLRAALKKKRSCIMPSKRNSELKCEWPTYRPEGPVSVDRPGRATGFGRTEYMLAF